MLLLTTETLHLIAPFRLFNVRATAITKLRILHQPQTRPFIGDFVLVDRGCCSCRLKGPPQHCADVTAVQVQAAKWARGRQNISLRLYGGYPTDETRLAAFVQAARQDDTWRGGI